MPGTREKEIKKAFRRSLVANAAIAKGAIITEKMLGVKRPGTGIPSFLKQRLLAFEPAQPFPYTCPVFEH